MESVCPSRDAIAIVVKCCSRSLRRTRRHRSPGSQAVERLPEHARAEATRLRRRAGCGRSTRTKAPSTRSGTMLGRRRSWRRSRRAATGRRRCPDRHLGGRRDDVRASDGPARPRGQTPNELLIASATQPAQSLANRARRTGPARGARRPRPLARQDGRWPDAASMLGFASFKRSFPESHNRYLPRRTTTAVLIPLQHCPKSAFQVAARARGARTRGRRAARWSLLGLALRF